MEFLFLEEQMRLFRLERRLSDPTGHFGRFGILLDVTGVIWEAQRALVRSKWSERVLKRLAHAIRRDPLGWTGDTAELGNLIEQLHALYDGLQEDVDRARRLFNRARKFRNKCRYRRLRHLAWALGQVVHFSILRHDCLVRSQQELAFLLADLEPPAHTFATVADLKKALS
jgi:hypothetical protein